MWNCQLRLQKRKERKDQNNEDNENNEINEDKYMNNF